jgi:hypothetical protein
LEQRDGLRLALLRHPDLQAVELDWSTGVIVATMMGKAMSHLTTPDAYDLPVAATPVRKSIWHDMVRNR